MAAVFNDVWSSVSLLALKLHFNSCRQYVVLFVEALRTEAYQRHRCVGQLCNVHPHLCSSCKLTDQVSHLPKHQVPFLFPAILCIVSVISSPYMHTNNNIITLTAC